jgi:hypothetical protein
MDAASASDEEFLEPAVTSLDATSRQHSSAYSSAWSDADAEHAVARLAARDASLRGFTPSPVAQLASMWEARTGQADTGGLTGSGCGATVHPGSDGGAPPAQTSLTDVAAESTAAPATKPGHASSEAAAGTGSSQEDAVAAAAPLPAAAEEQRQQRQQQQQERRRSESSSATNEVAGMTAEGAAGADAVSAAAEGGAAAREVTASPSEPAPLLSHASLNGAGPAAAVAAPAGTAAAAPAAAPAHVRSASAISFGSLESDGALTKAAAAAAAGASSGSDAEEGSDYGGEPSAAAEEEGSSAGDAAMAAKASSGQQQQQQQLEGQEPEAFELQPVQGSNSTSEAAAAAAPEADVNIEAAAGAATATGSVDGPALDVGTPALAPAPRLEVRRMRWALGSQPHDALRGMESSWPAAEALGHLLG